MKHTREQLILKLLLNKQFYEDHKHLLCAEIFGDFFSELYETVCYSHEKSKNNIEESQLYELYLVRHPTINKSHRNTIHNAIEKLEAIDNIDYTLGSELINKLWRKNKAETIITAASDIINNPDQDFSQIKELLETADNKITEYPSILPIEKSVGNILTKLAHDKFTFNLPNLQAATNGIGPGIFLVIYGRPEMGKTGFWVSLVGNKDGFLQQGAKILALINEEPAERTFLRLVSAVTNQTYEEILTNIEKTNQLLKGVFDNLIIADVVGLSIQELDAYLKEHEIDILIIDNLDKLYKKGTYNRDDERIRSLYTAARELAKAHNCVVIATSQANAEAENKINLSLDMLENSRTGKAAEADVVIGITKPSNQTVYSDITESALRHIVINKNKLTGIHCIIHCQLEREKSRYVP